jgi:hypothetical protein
VGSPRWLADLPLILRFGVAGALILGFAGCVAGLVIGLTAYAPTAWFATFELGVPSAITGLAVGAMVGAAVSLGVRRRHT